jgi:hypothetical protein
MEVVPEWRAASGGAPHAMTWKNLLRETIFAIGLALGLAGCGVSFAPLPAGSIAGRAGTYDYSPSVIQTGNFEEIWWCGSAYNPTDKTQFSDTVEYESIDLSTHARYGPVPVLAETQGGWDSVYTCNPKVVQGSFTNPLGDGKTFTYAMYYVATGFLSGTDNSIGVAFSNDGISWRKYPHPVLTPATQDNFFGIGQPAVFNTDQHQSIRIFYENCCTYVSHVEAVSSDGVHFTTLGTLTTKGMEADDLTWGDMAYDPGSGYWYAAFHAGLRDPSTTGGIVERGQYGIELYRIRDSSLLTGATPWELLTNIDTNLTGYESNFLPGFVRDMYGDLVLTPAIQMVPSISNPPPPWNASPASAGMSGSIADWKVSSFAWTPDPPPAALNRYFNQTTHEVTTGWIDPNGGFSLQSTLGHLYQSPQAGATVPFYGCKSGSTDYFVSLDSACEGARILGVDGFGYARPVAGLNLVTLYRCKTSTDHFVSTDPKCEGASTQEILGYVRP